MNSRRRRQADDSGFTLVELLIYMSLSVLILFVVGSMFINALVAQNRIEDTTRASNDGQLVANLLQQDVRNATRVSPVAVLSGDYAVRMRSADAAKTYGNWRCITWYWSAGTSRMWRSATTSSATPAASPWPTSRLTPSQLSSGDWLLVGDEITASGTTAVLVSDINGTRLDATYVAGDATETVPFTFTTTSRNPNGTSSPCF